MAPEYFMQKKLCYALKCYKEGKLVDCKDACLQVLNLKKSGQDDRKGSKDMSSSLPELLLLAKCCCHLSENSEGRQYLHDALRLANERVRAAENEISFSTTCTMQILGELFVMYDHPLLGEKTLLRHKKLVEKQFGQNHLVSSDCYMILSVFYFHVAKVEAEKNSSSLVSGAGDHPYNHALDFAQECLRVRSAILNDKHVLAAEAFYNLSIILMGYRRALISALQLDPSGTRMKNLTADVIDNLYKAREIYCLCFTARSLEVLQVDLLLFDIFTSNKQYKEMLEFAESNYKTSALLVGKHRKLTQVLCGKLKEVYFHLFNEKYPKDSMNHKGILSQLLENVEESKTEENLDDGILVITENEPNQPPELAKIPQFMDCAALGRALGQPLIQREYPKELLQLLQRFLENSSYQKVHREVLMDVIGLLYPKQVYALLGALREFCVQQEAKKRLIALTKTNKMKKLETGFKRRSIIPQLLKMKADHFKDPESEPEKLFLRDVNKGSTSKDLAAINFLENLVAMEDVPKPSKPPPPTPPLLLDTSEAEVVQPELIQTEKEAVPNFAPKPTTSLAQDLMNEIKNKSAQKKPAEKDIVSVDRDVFSTHARKLVEALTKEKQPSDENVGKGLTTIIENLRKLKTESYPPGAVKAIQTYIDDSMVLNISIHPLEKKLQGFREMLHNWLSYSIYTEELQLLQKNGIRLLETIVGLEDSPSLSTILTLIHLISVEDLQQQPLCENLLNAWNELNPSQEIVQEIFKNVKWDPEIVSIIQARKNQIFTDSFLEAAEAVQISGKDRVESMPKISTDYIKLADVSKWQERMNTEISGILKTYQHVTTRSAELLIHLGESIEHKESIAEIIERLLSVVSKIYESVH